MTKTCFFSDCKEAVNERGKFCQKHDAEEIKAKEDLDRLFKNTKKMKQEKID